MEFRDVLPLLPFQPQTLDKQLDLLDKLKLWFNSPTHVRSVITHRLSKLFEHQDFNDICINHRRLFLQGESRLRIMGETRNSDALFGDILKGLAQTKLGRDLQYSDPGFKLLLSLVRRWSNEQS